MSIAGFFKSLSRQQKNTLANTPIFAFLNGQTPPKMGEKEFLMAYRGWVYACVNAIAEEVSSIEIELQQSVGINEWKDIQNNPALQLLNDVNPFWSSSDLLFATSAFLKLHGNTFWYLPRNGGGKPSEIWVLDPTRTWVVKSETEYIAGYVFQNEKGEKIPFDVREIIHFRKFNPRNPYRGMGAVEAAGLAVDTDSFAAQYQRNFFFNSAMPSGVLSTDGTLNQDQYDRIRANWDSKFKGVDNAHKMAILEGGLKFTNISPTSKEMEFAQSRKDLRDEILGIFRVPKSILGVTEDVNRANAEASEYFFTKHVVKPEMDFITSRLNEFFLPMFNLDPNKFRFHFDDPVPQDESMAMQVRASGIQNGYITPNEARAEVGKEPLEGGDELFISSTLVPISQAFIKDDPATTEQVDQELEDEEDNQDGDTKSIKKKSKKEFNKDEFIATQTSKQAKVIRKTFTALEKQLLENLKNRKSIRQDQQPLLYRLKDVINPTDQLVRILFSNYADWIGILHNATEKGIQTIYETSGKQALKQVNVDASFDVQNPSALDYLNNHALEQATQVSDTIKEDLTLELMQGVEAGTSDDDIAKVISGFFETQGDWRAQRIARTETIDAYSQGSLEGYKQSGVVSGKQWLWDDGECKSGQCPSNQDDGTIGINDDFSSGDDAPPAHPNCECSLIPVVANDE